jgi:hypothetical protein
MTSIEAVRALVERGEGAGAIWRERWGPPTTTTIPTRVVLLEARAKHLVWEQSRTAFTPLATDLLATDWKWSPT